MNIKRYYKISPQLVFTEIYTHDSYNNIAETFSESCRIEQVTKEEFDSKVEVG
jgi:hypothetical protein